MAGIAVPPATQTRYGVAVGVGETDNVNLSSTKKSQTLAAVNGDFSLLHGGSRLDASALGAFSYIDYVQHAYGNHLYGRFDGLATLKLWPEHLNWVTREDYGQSQLDPFGSLTPNNLERVNVLTTGPDLTLRPTDTSFMELEALYQRVTYQTSPFDGNTLSGSVAVGRQISGLSKISLVAQVQRFRFDNTTVNVNFDRRELYGEYSIVGARTGLNVQLGASQVNDAGPWKTSPLARLLLTRKVSPFSAIKLSAGRVYRDATGAFTDLRPGAAGGIAIGGVAQTTANYLSNYGSAEWAFSRLRTSLGLTGRWERDTYDRPSAAIYNVTRTDVELNLGRRLTRALSANVTGTYSRTAYVNQGFTDKYGTVGAALVWRASRWAEVYARYDHSFRTPGGPQAAAAAGGYGENRVFLMVGYRPHKTADEPGSETQVLPGAPY